MKKGLCVFLILAVIIAAFPISVFAAQAEFDVKSSVIVIGADANKTDTYAANRLKYYLDKITGTNIPVVPDSSAVAQNEISVGNTNRTQADLSTLDDGGYIITSTTDKVVISGAGNKGTINGVYAFLEKYCGCHWYETQVTVIPENADLSVPANINIKYEPFFEYTETDTASSRDAEFSLANGLNGGVYRTLTEEQGSAVSYLGTFCHTLSTFYCKSEKYFDTHPEYYALHDGKRVPNQLCLTNSAVIDIVTKEVLDVLKTSHNPNASIQIVSLTQHDNQDYCQCKNCAAIDNENGSQSGTMITFVNTIAQRVKAAGSYENVVFDTFAYQYTRKAPTKVVPRSDVVVRLCSIECCFGHTLDNPDCKENAAFMKDLSDWGKICNRIYIWDYVNNYYETVCLFPNFNVLQRNVQIFYENNVKGVYEEGNYYISESDGEFGELRTYLLSKLMQNPYLDYSSEMNGYLEAVYGPGGKYIREFIDIISEHAVTKNKHLTIYQHAKDTLYNMKNSDIKQCDALWEKAKDAAQTEDQLNQLLRSELCWRYWKCANRKSEFSRWQFPYLWMNENQQLYNDFIKMGVKRLSEGNNRYLSDCDLLYLFREPIKWTKLYDEPIWDFLNPLAVDLYEFLEKVYHFFK